MLHFLCIQLQFPETYLSSSLHNNVQLIREQLSIVSRRTGNAARGRPRLRTIELDSSSTTGLDSTCADHSKSKWRQIFLIFSFLATNSIKLNLNLNLRRLCSARDAPCTHCVLPMLVGQKREARHTSCMSGCTFFLKKLTTFFSCRPQKTF